RLIYALGIRHVGETNAKRFARHYRTWEAFRAAAEAARLPAAIEAAEQGEVPSRRTAKDPGNDAWQEMTGIEGIGEVVAEAVVDFFAEPRNREALDRLEAELAPEPEAAPAAASSPVA